MGVTFSQFFPPTPSLTEANLPSQKGKVFIVTGGYSGVGLELCNILYQAGGKVYIAGRSAEKAQQAISDIKSRATKTTAGGDLAFLELSLDDLTTIKPAVEAFHAAEDRLDVLFNNAGVSNPPHGSVSKQGIELTLATNCIGPHLLTELLLPTLQRTAHTAPRGHVRVVWTSSIVVDVSAPKEGLQLADLKTVPRDTQKSYTNSKTGNWFLASSLARRVGASDGIVSVTQNPGNLKTELLRHFSAFASWLIAPLLYEAKFGAYTELWAGLSPELGVQDGGAYIVPWGRKHPAPSAGVLEAMKEEGGTGVAGEFVKWCDEKIRDYM